MTEEPYRWLEAIENRREYIREQLKDGSPTFAVSLPDGILHVGVGAGHSKVFEVFDRHALVGLGHPADLEKIRQAVIDAAHLEAFTRAPEDVSLRRLVGFGLGPQLKNGFEQIFAAPFLVELILTELGATANDDSLIRVCYDGSYKPATGNVAVAASKADKEEEAREWLTSQLREVSDPQIAIDILLQCWWCMTHQHSLSTNIPSREERQQGWKSSLSKSKTAEIGWLERRSKNRARFKFIQPAQANA